MCINRAKSGTLYFNTHNLVIWNIVEYIILVDGPKLNKMRLKYTFSLIS